MSEHIPVLPTRHHDLMQWSQPVFFLQKVFRVHPNEVKLLLWVTAIQLVMSSSAIQINNFAQSAFLKRFGVNALPTVFLAEAVITFFFSGLVGILMERYRNVRIFTGLLVYFGFCIGLIRLLLPFGFVWVYPVLYILKSQSVAILPILYWDILSDLFTTQQSKRLFTLVTAGGVLGTTVGSLMTGRLSDWFGAENLLLIFVAGMALAAVLNELTERILNAPIETRIDGRKGKLEGKFSDNLREFVAQARQSVLLKYMILIIGIPNVLLPIMDYQFNVVVDNHFATEAATLHFFGLYRGVSNAVMFGILMVSGRIITRIGVPGSLLFHPANYLLAFGALFLRFDIVSGVYARFSTEALKTTLNNPARAVLYNFFPQKSRALIRIFLRGAVVRVSDFTGSGVLILIKGLLDPRWLSVVAVPLAVIWLFTNIRLKKAYPAILAQTLADKHIDWSTIEESGLQALAGDKRLLDNLKQRILTSDPETAVLCAEILAAARPPGWSDAVVDGLRDRPAETQKRLMDQLLPEDGGPVVDRLVLLTRSALPDILPHLLKTITRLDPRRCPSVTEDFLDHPDRRVRIQALACTYFGQSQASMTLFRHRLTNLLKGDESDVRMALEILGKTGDDAFADSLLRFSAGEDPQLKAWALDGLTKMNHPKAAEIARTAIEDPSPQVRKAAVGALGMLKGTIPVPRMVSRLSDPDPGVRSRAAEVIRELDREAVPDLLSALHLPSRALRNEILALLNDIGVPAATVSSFVVRELTAAYGCLCQVQALESRPLSPALNLCREHLLEKHEAIIEIVLRVLGNTAFGDRMKLIIRAIQSQEKRDADNAIEALESILHPDIRRLLLPLLGDGTVAEKLIPARERLGDRLSTTVSFEEVFKELMEDPDPLIRVLGLYAAGEWGQNDSLRSDFLRYRDSKDGRIREAAGWALDGPEAGVHTRDPSAMRPPLVENTRWIRQVPLFVNLRVQELLAVATVMTSRRYATNDIVFLEGMPYDHLYLVYEGGISLITDADTDRPKVLDRIEVNGFFGEISIIHGKNQPYTAKAESDALIYMLRADDFSCLMKDYPVLTLNLCRVFIQRMRHYQSRLEQSRTAP